MPTRIAYVVLSHDAPDLLLRLVTRLLDGDPHCHVLVDHDAAGPALPWAARHGDRLCVVRRRRAGGWGGYGLVTATLASMRDVRARLDPDWVVLLSGRDAVVADPARVGDWLGDADAHLEPGRVVSPQRTREDAYAHARYFYRWYALPRWRGPRAPAAVTRVRLGLQRRLSLAQGLVFVWSLPRGAGTHVGLRRPHHPFGAALPCRFGSQWLALSRRGLARTLDRLDGDPALERWFRRTLVADEALFTTLVHADPTLVVVPGSPTAVWMEDAGGGAHPATLTAADLPRIRATGRPFARKVDLPASAGLLAALEDPAERGDD